MVCQKSFCSQFITSLVPKLSSYGKTITNFNTFTALILIMAWAISASKRSNTGSPAYRNVLSNNFQFRPQLVPCSRKEVTSASKRGTASMSPQKRIISNFIPVQFFSFFMPNLGYMATDHNTKFFCQVFLAIAPAATRIAVSRALERPPPR